MSEDLQQVERDDAASIFDPDPVLGGYVSHHPSNRVLLMIRAGLFYGVAVIALQLVFFPVPDATAGIYLPIAFAAVAGATFWYMLHHWNREVVLYQRGFTYRQGSATAYILYANVIKLLQNIEVVGAGSLKRRFFDYKLVTDMDETLPITNVYSNPDKLTRLLEKFITRDRLQLLEGRLAKGENVSLAPDFTLTSEGILRAEDELFWHEYRGARVKNGQITIASSRDEAWATLPADSFDNPLLALAALKQLGKAHSRDASTAPAVQSGEV